MPGLRPVAHPLTTTNTQADPKAAELLKLLHEFKALLRMWELFMGHAKGL
jgi:hypothetical protein